MDLFSELMAMPTGIFTVLLGLVILYWVLFLIGGLDLDVLGGADGAAEGALEGAAEGALEGAAGGAVEGAADGALDGVDRVDGAVEGATGLLQTLKLRSVPATSTTTSRPAPSPSSPPTPCSSRPATCRRVDHALTTR